MDVKKIKYILRKLMEKKGNPRFLLSKFACWANITLPFKIRIDNIVFKHYPTSIASGLWLKDYSIDSDLFVIKNYIEENFICFDVGANIGHLTALMAEKASKGIVFAFEPARKIFPYLLETINLNGLKNVIPFNIAISDSNGFFEFHEFLKADDQSSLVSGNKSIDWEKITINIPTMRLDTFCEIFNIRDINFLKIDVEGAEFLVLQSSGKMSSNVDIIWFEYIEENYLNFGYEGKKVIDFLKTNNFEIKGLFNGNLIEISKIDLKNWKGNLLALKKQNA